MEFKTTNVFQRTVAAYRTPGKRLIVNEGGTSSSKTFSVVQLFALIATYRKKPTLLSIVAESVPHLKRGALRDFKNIIGGEWSDSCWSAQDSTYHFGKNQLEFFSADNSSKLRGGRRDFLFINEANNITKDSFDELDVRTRICTFIDHNPVAEYWAHELKNEPFCAWIHSTYLDALPFLDESMVLNIRSRKDRDPNWWRVYGLGIVGKLEGLIHSEFKQIKELPAGGKEVYGLDWGFSPDPCALVRNRIIGDGLYSQELIYERGMTNARLMQRMEQLGVRKGYDVIIADCEDPKSIQELYEHGWDIRPCKKGPDSLLYGIQRINEYRQHWTEDSLNAIKEQRNYQWEKDKDGKFTNKPIDGWNHCMDCRRYAVESSPASKVLPAYNCLGGSASHFRKYDLKWNMRMIPKHTCLHYGAMSLSEDVRLYVTGAIWDKRAGLLFVYYEQFYAIPLVTEVVSDCVRAMHLNDFYFERMLANKAMMEQDKQGLSKVFNKEFQKQAPRQYVKLRQPQRYEAMGSIALLNAMAERHTLYVHADNCKDTNQELSTWVVEDSGSGSRKAEKPPGKVQVRGYRENLLMIVSELRRDPRFERPVKPPPYSPDYTEAPV